MLFYCFFFIIFYFYFSDFYKELKHNNYERTEFVFLFYKNEIVNEDEIEKKEFSANDFLFIY